MKTLANPIAPAFQPLYRQIKTLITQSLVSGEWRPGELIPSEIELASRFSVSQGTVRKAIGELADQNLLVRQQGKGTFVASHSEERSKFPYLRITPDRGALDELAASLIDCRKAKLDAASGKKLGLAAGTAAFVVTRTLSVSGKKAIYEEIRLPAARFKGLSSEVIERHHCMLYSMYETEYDIRILHVEEQIKALAAEKTAAHHLGIPEGLPLLVIERVAYTYADKAVELRRSYCSTREHHYRNRIV
ncbi:MAG TPA: GntR family transcriptional regulator [Burkholderiales bacterium]|nr:GntR family transcriptional regulator [Burkholderiales bacterium]